MSRVTAPVSKLSRAISSTPAIRSNSTLIDNSTHNAGAVLMPKYAELLRNRRSSEHTDSSRGLTTTHRPTPQPSIANRAKPLMQTFHSSAPKAASSNHIDAAVLPSTTHFASADSLPRMPLLPDNYSGAYGSMSDSSETIPNVAIFAANPENVLSATPLHEIEGITLDGVELKFMHEQQATEAGQEEEGGMLRDLWKGMVDDVMGPTRKAM